ncbi:hypothetical protein Nepgr_027329 [Nepenthes gracilis]|uniref:Cellulose synthase-like protein E1 n=1 Tax=Nepenthes gracilis TaxID=150966 RepID=A0AAD3Y3F6_NEPGR|nr:hypothetical protein Nepgr_027329 [Nepenthes gracilis]
MTQLLVQQKRWGEGLLQLMLSKYSPLWRGCGRISFGLQLGYSYYGLWAANGLATLCYSTIPSLFLLKGIPVFPEISGPWFVPFAYIIITKYTYSLAEYLWSQGTVRGWWNEQRVWLYKRNSSYLFASLAAILRLLGLSDLKFVVTDKVADENASERYEMEVMEFGESSPMFTPLAALALMNLLCFAAVLNRAAMDGGGIMMIVETMGLQILLCVALVLINLPLYEAMFFRKDDGKMPRDVTMKSVVYASLVCSGFSLLLLKG